MEKDPTSVVEAVRTALAAPEAPPPGARVVVGVSGGLDSTALLHLLRFPLAGRLRPVVAHLDHGWRAESAADAAWVRGICRAWDVPFRGARASVTPASEEEARRARYALFERTAEELGATAILTAHHADDQAETILFRVLRGTGLRGLGGIPVARDGVIFRPLLGVWREELEEYARAFGLRWRDDSTNEDRAFARNAVRHVLLPEAERIAPGARRALVRLGRIASAEEEAWSSLVETLLSGLEVDERAGEVSFPARAWLTWPVPVQGRALRVLARRLGVDLDAAATDRGVRFGSAGRSGGVIDLGGGAELRRSFDRILLRIRTDPTADRPLEIVRTGAGRGSVVLGGRRLAVWWSAEDATAVETTGSAESPVRRARLAVVRYPLVVRGRAAGDRIRLQSGTKTLKKLLIEARVPAHLRSGQPVVVDGRGVVLWVPGIARSVEAERHEHGDTLTLGIG